MMEDDGLGETETCSWCTTEVPWRSLTETVEGNLCRECMNSEDGRALQDA